MRQGHRIFSIGENAIARICTVICAISAEAPVIVLGRGTHMSLKAPGKAAGNTLKSAFLSASTIVGVTTCAASASAQVTELEGVTIYSAN